jgi:putative membrane protein
MMWGYNGFGFGGGGMGIGMLLFWGLIVVVVVMLVRGWSQTSRSGVGEIRPVERTAMDILRERYARGEIDKSEFEEKRNDLQSSATTAKDQRQPT